MKKLILCMLVSAVFTACGNDNDKATNDSDSGTTSTDNKAVNDGDTINNMPGNVRTSFTNRYPTAVVEKWKTDTENNQQVYKVEFKQGDVEKKAYFDSAGNFLREEND
jgi:hypothetical protein